MQNFLFLIKHKSRVTNYLANALSLRIVLLIMLRENIVGLKYLKKIYKEDEDFGKFGLRVQEVNLLNTFTSARDSFLRKSTVHVAKFLEERS